jgi:hypothetical protein
MRQENHKNFLEEYRLNVEHIKCQIYGRYAKVT